MAKKGQTTVYSEGGLGVPISKQAAELMSRFASSESDASYTAEKALCHNWFIRARRGEVPVRKETSKRGAKKSEDPKTPRSSRSAKERAKSTDKGGKDKDSDPKPAKSAKAKLGEVEAAPVPEAGWFGSRAQLPRNFVAKLRAFCAANSVSKAILLVGADFLGEDASFPLSVYYPNIL